VLTIVRAAIKTKPQPQLARGVTHHAKVARPRLSPPAERGRGGPVAPPDTV